MKLHLFVVVIFAFVRLCCAGDLSLRESLDRALEKNPRIQQAKAGLEQAAGQRLVFRSAELPVASLSVPVGAQGGHRVGQGPFEPFAFATGVFRQPLYQAGIPAAVRRGDLAMLVAAQQLNVVVVDQLHLVRTAFYTALFNRSLEELGRSQRQRLDANLASEQARYEAGSVDRGALARATLIARDLDPKIDEAHRAYGIAVLQLATAMGDDLAPGATLPVPHGELDFVPVDFRLQSETNAALERRADLRLARLLVRVAQEDQRIVAADYYPQLNLDLFGRYIPVTNIREASSGSPQRSDDLVSSEFRAGASYTWRVIDNGKVSGAIMRQRSIREINELQLKKLKTSVAGELAGLQNSFRAITARHDSLTKAADAAEQNIAVVENSWQQGLASELELRTAETGLLSTRTGILEAAYEQKMRRAEWDRATGRYFQFSDGTFLSRPSSKN